MEEIKKQAREMFDAQVTPNISLNDPFQKMYTKLHLVPFIKNFIDSIINLAVSRERERNIFIVEDECSWYNTNNQIPDSELYKSEEHWNMLQKIVKDSLQEVNEGIVKRINTK